MNDPSDPSDPTPQRDVNRVRTLAYARPSMAPRRPRLPWLALAAATIAWVPVLVTVLQRISMRLRAVALLLGSCALGLAVGAVLRPARPRVLFDVLEIFALLAAVTGFAAAIWLYRR
jgi:hypothetical protein